MLNELHALERGVSALGVESLARHPDFAQLRKGDALRIRLNAPGEIDEIEFLPAERRLEIWTLGDGNHNRFPGIKTPKGILLLDAEAGVRHEERWKAAKTAASKRREIVALASAYGVDEKLSGWPSYRKRIEERLESLAPLADDPLTAAVPAVFQRFLKTLELEPSFMQRLFRALCERAEHGDHVWLDPVRAALTKSIPLTFDVTRDFPRDVADPRQIGPISQVLSRPSTSDAASDKTCALSGTGDHLLSGSFPRATLPSLGQTFLFARNQDIPALARYGRNGPGAFPIDKHLVSRFSGIIADITAAAKRDKTWRLLPTESGDGQDLLIAFIASASDAPIAALLAAGEEEDLDGPAILDKIGQQLIEMWKGVAQRAAPGECARILILRTVDPGNRKAVLDARPSVESLHRSARAWVGAMANAPEWITWRVFVKKKIVAGRPKLQAPLSLIGQSRRLYIRGGREVVKVPGISGGEALALFLGHGSASRRALRILKLLVTNQDILISGLAHARVRDCLKDFDRTGNLRADALRLVAWLGALLSIIGRTKDLYMDDVGFKLGQLLSAVDVVHMGYCADMRNEQIPPTLVGNSVFAAAGRNPDRALDVLQTRWKPYSAWVRKASNGRRPEPAKDDKKGWAIRRAVSHWRRADQLCHDLQPALAKMREERRVPDEAFRAELLLGYIAGLKPEPKPDSSGSAGETNGAIKEENK